MTDLVHPSMRAAIAHAQADQRLPDGTLDCEACRNRAEHGTLEGYTNWRCRCAECREGSRVARYNYQANRWKCKVEGGSTVNHLAKWKIEQKIARGSCADCGLVCHEENYVCFDWDHRPGEVKLYAVAGMMKAMATVAAEMAKCDLVCANCHRLRTHRRGQCLTAKSKHRKE